METSILILVLVVDVALVAGFYFLFKRQRPVLQTLEELHEEHLLIKEISHSIKEDVTEFNKTYQIAIDKVSHLAMEVELELSSAREGLQGEMEKVLIELKEKISSPIDQLHNHQLKIEKLDKNLEQKRKQLVMTTKRAEQICQFFNKNIPYEDILAEIESKKYKDVRSMLAQGLNEEKIAKELGMRTSEISAISRMTL